MTEPTDRLRAEVEALRAENARLKGVIAYVAECSDDPHISRKAFTALATGEKP